MINIIRKEKFLKKVILFKDNNFGTYDKYEIHNIKVPWLDIARINENDYINNINLSNSLIEYNNQSILKVIKDLHLENKDLYAFKDNWKVFSYEES